MAEQAAPLQAVVDPDYPEFVKPGEMPEKILAYCRTTGQRVPETRGEVLRCALESIALKYRWVLDRLEKTAGRSYGTIHIVGGGTQNQLLSQFTADCTGRTVVTGPVEATAAGNVIMQAIATGHIASLAEGRRIVRNSNPVLTFQPGDGAAWDAIYPRFCELVG